MRAIDELALYSGMERDIDVLAIAYERVEKLLNDAVAIANAAAPTPIAS